MNSNIAYPPAHDPEFMSDADRIEIELSQRNLHGAAQLITRLLREIRDLQGHLRAAAKLKRENYEIIERQKRELRGLREALQSLYSETADYITINHLGPVHWNHSMQLARSTLAASPASVESEREPPYYTQGFWSPCRKYIVTACVPSPGSSITLVDDNGDVWDPTGPCQDMTEFAALALTQQKQQESGNGNV